MMLPRTLSPQASSTVLVIGVVLINSGIGNGLRDGFHPALTVIFAVLGLGVVGYGLTARRRWYRTEGVQPPSLRRDLLAILAGIAAGTVALAVLTLFSDQRN